MLNAEGLYRHLVAKILNTSLLCSFYKKTSDIKKKAIINIFLHFVSLAGTESVELKHFVVKI